MKTRRERSWGGALALVAALALPGTASPREARPPALAGSWYPDGRARLLSAAHYLMRTAASVPRLGGKPIALVVPHAGWNFSGLAAAAAYRQLDRGEFDRVVVVAPSHHGAFRGYALDDAVAYRTPLGEIPLCEGVAKTLASDIARVVPGVTGPEHAVEIELPFLQAALGDFCLVPILAGDTDARIQSEFAERLAGLDDRHTLFVFSSDFAHYGPRFGFEPFGPLSAATREKIREMDDRAVALLEERDADRFRSYLRETGNTICGRHGLATLLELLARIAPRARATLLAHYASADLPGVNDAGSVTYVTLGYVRPPESEANGIAPGPGAPLVELPAVETVAPDAPQVAHELGRRLVRLARATIETEIGGRDGLERALAEWPKGREQERRQGVFVTLNRTSPEEIRRHGRLRGCIGQALPTFPLYFGTVQAAVDAALQDERFQPVTASELARLEVEVTVLSPPRPVASARDIQIGTHGIVLEKGDKAALFLPQVATEHGWTTEQTLNALAQKAGLPPEGWKDDARLFVFTGQVFQEHR